MLLVTDDGNIAQFPVNKDKVKNKQITSKVIVTGVTLGIITALTTGVGCVVAGVGLPMLVIASIAMAAALVVGVVAGGIMYAVSKPSGDKRLDIESVPSLGVNGIQTTRNVVNGLAT